MEFLIVVIVIIVFILIKKGLNRNPITNPELIGGAKPPQRRWPTEPSIRKPNTEYQSAWATPRPLEEESDDTYSVLYDVVGESFNNDDGSSRQSIIKKYGEEGAAAHLKFYNYKGSLACAVYLDKAHKKQIGHISKKEVAEVYELVTTNDNFSLYIYSIGSGKKGLFGVTLEFVIEE